MDPVVYQVSTRLLVGVRSSGAGNADPASGCVASLRAQVQYPACLLQDASWARGTLPFCGGGSHHGSDRRAI